MKRKVLRIRLVPGSPMANCDWLPAVIDGEIQLDQISLPVVMTLLGKRLTIQEADAEITNLPHIVDDFKKENSYSKSNYNKEILGLP